MTRLKFVDITENDFSKVYCSEKRRGSRGIRVCGNGRACREAQYGGVAGGDMSWCMAMGAHRQACTVGLQVAM